MEDTDEVNLMRANAKNDNSDLEFNDHSVREPFDSRRADYIKQKIEERIQRASVCIVHVSENTAQSRWVKWEVEKSLHLGKTVIATHTANGKPKVMPDWISANKIRVVPWSDLPDSIK